MLSTGTPPPRTVWSGPAGGVAGGELLYWVLILIAFVASCVLARRNLRGGEGDRRGAWRLSVTVGFGALVFAARRAHHVPSAVDELAWLLLVTFLMWLPLTLDPSAWYFGQSLSLMLLITGLGMYGFLGALGGRPAFGLMEPT